MAVYKLTIQINPSGNLMERVPLVGIGATEIVAEINGDVSRPDAFGENEFYGFGLRLIGLDAGIPDVGYFYLCAV